MARQVRIEYATLNLSLFATFSAAVPECPTRRACPLRKHIDRPIQGADRAPEVHFSNKPNLPGRSTFSSILRVRATHQKYCGAFVFAVLLHLLAVAPLHAQSGASNRVLELDGKGSYVELPVNIFNNLTNATVEAWVKWRWLLGGQRFFSYGSSMHDFSIGLDYFSEGRPGLTLGVCDSATFHRLTVIGILRKDEWCHVAATSGPGGMRLYFNGALLANNDFPYSFPNLGSGTPNYIGRMNFGPDFNGAVDEFRVWRVARTEEQIRDNMFKDLTGREPGLVGLWNFNDGTARDSTTNAYHGRFIGKASTMEARRPSGVAGELIAMISFSGQVTDGAGRPAVKATVRIDRDREILGTATTDATGTYQMAFRYAPGSYDLFAELGQFGVWRTNATVAPQTPARFDLALTSSSIISGALLALDGTPHVGAVAEAEDAASGRVTANATSDAQGKFTFRNLRPGAYRIRARGANGFVYYADRLLLEQAPNKITMNIDLRFPPSKKGVWEVFNTVRGLADDNQISKILIEPDGSVWFATQGGASRFDGHEFANFTTEDGLPDNFVLNMARDSRGNIWFSTENGIARYDGKKIEKWTGAQIANHRRLGNIYAAPDGKVWFASLEGDPATMFSFDGEKLSYFGGTNAGLAPFNKMAGDGKGIIWMASDDGLLRFDGTNFINVTEQASMALGWISAVGVDANGKVWFFSLGSGIGSYDGTNIVTYGRIPGRDTDFISFIHGTPDGAVWFAGRVGVARFDGTNFVNFTKEDGLPDGRIISVTSSPDGVMYFGSENGGAARYDPTTFTSYTTADGLAANSTWHSFVAADGGVWFGRDASAAPHVPVEGISRFDGQEFTPLAEANLFSVPGSMAQTRDGILWLPARGKGAVRFDGTNFLRSFAAEDGLADGVYAMATAPDSSLWAGTGNGLAHLVDGRWQNFQSPSGTRISSVVCDSKGTVWAGSSVWAGSYQGSSAWRFDGAGFQPLSTVSGSLIKAVFSLFIDRDDSLWIGTDEGAVRFDGKELTRITKSKGLLVNNFVQCVYRDRQNVLWFGTRAGATRFDGAVWSTLTKADGLAGSDVRTICEDKSGALWFGTDRGVTRYVAPRGAVPPPRVTVLLDKTYEPGGTLPSIERGRRVDIKINMTDRETRRQGCWRSKGLASSNGTTIPLERGRDRGTHAGGTIH